MNIAFGHHEFVEWDKQSAKSQIATKPKILSGGKWS